MKRTEEQIEAVAEFTPQELAAYRQFERLERDATGLDGIQAHSCWTNGQDTAEELGIKEANGFSYSEVQNAAGRFAVRTASLYELI